MFKKFPKLSQFVSTDNLRPVLQFVIPSETGNLIATDTHTLISLTAYGLVNACDAIPKSNKEQAKETLTSYALHIDELKKMEKGKTLIFDKEGVTIDVLYLKFTHIYIGDCIIRITDNNNRGVFPAYKQVIPCGDRFTYGLSTFNFNLKMLAKFQDLALSPVKLHIQDSANKTAILQTHSLEFDYSAYMLIMPIYEKIEQILDTSKMY